MKSHDLVMPINKDRNLIKDGLTMTAFNRRLKFVNIYTCKYVHCPSSIVYETCLTVGMVLLQLNRYVCMVSCN